MSPSAVASIAASQRSPVAPELPTIAESGYPGFEADTWAAMLGPAGMPAQIVAVLASGGSDVKAQSRC
ncbi:MAG: tripartite tricarboxylate transporter substrate-binding protein [Burkholderiales bacterium]